MHYLTTLSDHAATLPPIVIFAAIVGAAIVANIATDYL